MSFGFSIGDFVVLANLARDLYKQCKDAPEEFRNVRKEVDSLRVAIRQLRKEAESEHSLLNRGGPEELQRRKDLERIRENCSDILEEFQQLLHTYRSLGTNSKRTWDRVKFRSTDVQGIRNRLAVHVSSITILLDTLSTNSLGRIEKKIDDLAAEVRAGLREPSLISISDQSGSDQDVAWQGLVRELSEDFSASEIETYKDQIKSYIRLLVDRGDFEEREPASLVQLQGIPVRPKTVAGEPSRAVNGADDVRKAPRWPQQSTVESDSDSTISPRLGRLSRRASSTNIGAEIPDTVDETTFTQGKANPTFGSAKIFNFPATYRAETIEDLFPPNLFPNSPPEEDPYVGVDISFECCRVAAYDRRTEQAAVLQNEYGNYSTPTWIAFTSQEILIGEDAKAQAVSNFENSFCGFTLLLGSLFCDEITVAFRKNFDFQIDEVDGKPAFFVPCRQRHYSPEELAAFLIRKLVSIAENTLYVRVSSVALSDHSPMRLFKRQAYYRAADLAKIRCSNVCSSTAVALHWVNDNLDRSPLLYHANGRRHLLVIDLSEDSCVYSRFDLRYNEREKGLAWSLVSQKTAGRFKQTISTVNQLIALICSKFSTDNSDIPKVHPRRQLVKLRTAIEEAIRRLSNLEHALIHVDSFYQGLDLEYSLSRNQLSDILYSSLSSDSELCADNLFSPGDPREEIIGNRNDTLLIGDGKITQALGKLLPHVLQRRFWTVTVPQYQIKPADYAVLGLTTQLAQNLQWSTQNHPQYNYSFIVTTRRLSSIDSRSMPRLTDFPSPTTSARVSLPPVKPSSPAHTQLWHEVRQATTEYELVVTYSTPPEYMPLVPRYFLLSPHSIWTSPSIPLRCFCETKVTLPVWFKSSPGGASLGHYIGNNSSPALNVEMTIDPSGSHRPRPIRDSWGFHISKSGDLTVKERADTSVVQVSESGTVTVKETRSNVGLTGYILRYSNCGFPAEAEEEQMGNSFQSIRERGDKGPGSEADRAFTGVARSVIGGVTEAKPSTKSEIASSNTTEPGHVKQRSRRRKATNSTTTGSKAAEAKPKRRGWF